MIRREKRREHDKMLTKKTFNILLTSLYVVLPSFLRTSNCRRWLVRSTVAVSGGPSFAIGQKSSSWHHGFHQLKN